MSVFTDIGNFFQQGVQGAGQYFSGQNTISSDVSAVSTVITDAPKVITGVNDFLGWISWIFHPLNLLRAVEFVTGLFLFYLGLKPYLDRSGRTGGTLRRVVMASPAGRTVRTTQGARMGRREGQRESARMQARQRETRSQREASARERVQINRQARGRR